MRTSFGRRARKAGLAPGSLIHIGEQKVAKPQISVFDYNEEGFVEKTPESIEECFPLKETDTVSWINIDGLHDTHLIETIGKQFGLHPLILEDILNTQQRPKVDDFEDYLFLVLRMIYFNEAKNEIESEQVSVILGKNYVLTFQERPGDVFDPVRERIRKAKGRVRKDGCDYLAYTLLDAIVDNYFLVLEKVSERIEVLETAVMGDPTPRNLKDIHRLKNSMTFLRKSIGPLREIVSGLVRGGSKLIDETTEVYLRDLYDHTIQVTDAIDTFRDMLSGLIDVYLSSVSNKMNEIMKVLTIFAALFIPLTFLAGVYGMNFEFMPELKWRIGYPLILLLMICVAVVMLFYFRSKKWLWQRKTKVGIKAK